MLPIWYIQESGIISNFDIYWWYHFNIWFDVTIFSNENVVPGLENNYPGYSIQYTYPYFKKIK